MDKRKISVGAPGGSSLMVIFAVLCLVIFAVLSLSTAQAEMRLSRSSAEAVREYYLAEAEANRILSDIRSGRVPDGVGVSGDKYSYSCPISETRTLFVTVSVNGTGYSIERWQEVYTGEWDPDTSLDVWTGS